MSLGAQEIPDPLKDFKDFQSSLFKSLVSATAAANSISVEEVGFYRSLDRQFAKDLDHAGSSSLSMGNALLQHSAADCGATAKSFEDVDDVLDRYGSVVDVCDSLLEKADLCLDHMGGKVNQDDLKNNTPEITQIATKDKLDYKFLHANNVVRPQMKFKDKVDNSNSTPFERKIKYKPHALVPLDFTPVSEDKSLPHPYVYEINHIEYPERMFQISEPEIYQPYDTTSATWVDTEEALLEMLKHLEGQEEIAVDLEHHNYRSYQGFTCLMQLSTREQDFVIDALELRDKLWMLNEYFADPNITKVLHGAESDIIWLQRDFGLYIVNLFDTYFPTKVLDFPHHSLAHLLKKYCNFDADKKYQLADWRIRPLPEEMLNYARSDTHFLLYIYDCLRNELLTNSTSEGNLVRVCLQRSNDVALQKYEKEVYDAVLGLGPGGWKNMLSKWKYSLNPQQLAVFKALHSWRDHTAREGDESVRYVLPNHMLMTLVERMPTDSSGVIGCCNPCPTLVRMNAQAIGYAIQKAKLDALEPTKETPQQESKSKIEAQSVSSSNGAVTTTTQVQQVKRNISKVDPALFDLQKVKKLRLETTAQLEKKTSTLFGDCL
ncbi:ribonuclease H-like domain-containing protein [Gilbertella persicaria]|uniref:ribonuclease H-like domain-containing protein n=1 Tax=Gilbertella persicaria TaxID=101096 RepID=UPI002220EE11|nr:ribonuclease H-like domain-containing protein [Gilbertella persicaria]KAI8085942.1 ribonuclease H-like domain-containing protein [Gilbertella persicaria]